MHGFSFYESEAGCINGYPVCLVGLGFVGELHQIVIGGRLAIDYAIYVIPVSEDR